MPPKNKYANPKLREEIKEEVKQGDKGGEPGQWSARKAQMMAKEYKKRGGEYNEPKSKGQDDSGQHLDDWGKEDWQTKEGSGEAKQKDGNRKRYLPKKAWEEMNEKEKRETDEKKQKEGEDKQFVGNTPRAKRARKSAQDGAKEDSKEQEKAKPKPNSSKKRGRGKKDEDQIDDLEDAEEVDGLDDEEKATPAKKRKTEPKTKTPESKTSKDNSGGKTVGSKHMKSEPPAKQASLKRLPKKGQQAHWKAMPGWVDGEVVEVVRSEKKVDGKQVKASKDDPRIVLKSNASGKICVHKFDSVYFD